MSDMTITAADGAGTFNAYVATPSGDGPPGGGGGLPEILGGHASQRGRGC